MNEHPADEVPHGDFPGTVPVLEDSTARLRAMTAADLPFVVEMCGDAESARWTTVPQPYGLADARSFLEEHAAGWASDRGRRHWAIEPVDSASGPACAGVLDLRPGARREHPWEVGFALHPAARGRGLMSAALRLGARPRLAADLALRPVDDGGLGLRRLVAETAADNTASNRALAGAGFRQWGREEAADAPDGSVGPAIHWERLA